MKKHRYYAFYASDENAKVLKQFLKPIFEAFRLKGLEVYFNSEKVDWPTRYSTDKLEYEKPEARDKEAGFKVDQIEPTDGNKVVIHAIYEPDEEVMEREGRK